MQPGTRRKRPPGRGNDTRNGTSVRRSPNAWVGADRSTDRAGIPTIRPNPCHDDRGYRARNPFRVGVHDRADRTSAGRRCTQLAFNDYGRHLLISVDTRGYGGTDDIRQHEIQNELPAVLGGSAERAGLDRSTWHSQPAGDGELSVLPDDESEIRLGDDFFPALDPPPPRPDPARQTGATLTL